MMNSQGSRRLLSLGFIVLTGIGVPGCSVLKRKAKVGPEFTFRVAAEELANGNSPIAVDLVLVRDSKLLDRLVNMPATTWFEQREQLQRDLLGTPHMHYQSWEWVPAQKVDIPVHVKYPARGWAALVFARYRTPGQHRIRIDPIRNFTLHLGRDTFQVEPEQ